MTDGEKADVSDLMAAILALEAAVAALTAGGENGRDEVTWGIGFALGRLRRVRERAVTPAPPAPPRTISDWVEAKG